MLKIWHRHLNRSPADQLAAEVALQSKLGHRTLRQRCERVAPWEHWADHDLIFPSKSGTPMDSSNRRLDFVRVYQRCGLPKNRFHELRHTAASLLLNRGIPVITVSRQPGRAKASITLDVHGHLLPSMQNEVLR